MKICVQTNELSIKEAEEEHARNEFTNMKIEIVRRYKLQNNCYVNNITWFINDFEPRDRICPGI